MSILIGWWIYKKRLFALKALSTLRKGVERLHLEAVAGDEVKRGLKLGFKKIMLSVKMESSPSNIVMNFHISQMW